MDTQESGVKLDAKSFKSDQYVRWCPGCGDHGVLATLQKAMADLGIPTERTAVISGIGCSSRLPYYVNAYGFHTIHGRAAAIATGLKTARPDLCVWIATGDGDSLAIGGNHFIHAIRRNVDLNFILFNNPTSARGFVSKSSPYGTVEDPFIPAELCFGARGRFFARSLDIDMKLLGQCMLESARHKGASVVEVLVNCVIFNDGTHKGVSQREVRDDRSITLRHGEKMVFGKEKNKGIVLDGLRLKAVTIGEDGYTLDDILTHDAHEVDPTLHTMLAMMGTTGEEMPVAFGVIRDVADISYDEAVAQQIEEVKAQKPGIRSLEDILMKDPYWEVKE